MIDEKGHLSDIYKQLDLSKSIEEVRFFETGSGDFWMYAFGGGISHFTWNNSGFPEKDMQISTDNGLPNDYRGGYVHG
ncbi:MAG: hypothetical protein WDO16_18170 [Bacteroidota bacterium]